MEITYLGTAAAEGWPAVFCACEACKRARKEGGKNIRTRSQSIIDGRLVVDLPPDTYWHAIAHGINLAQVSDILITHSHQDHFYPPELILRAEPYAHDPAPILHIYGNGTVRDRYENARRQDDSRDMDDKVVFHEIKPFLPFSTSDGYRVTPIRAAHDPNEECLLFLIEKGGKTLFYSNDTSYYPEDTWEFLQGKRIDLVSLDCTLQMRHGGKNHMGFPENLKVRERLEEQGCADGTTKYVLTHFSHNGGMLHQEMRQQVEDKGFNVAYDGMSVSF